MTERTLREKIEALLVHPTHDQDDMIYNLAIGDALAALDAHTAEQPLNGGFENAVSDDIPPFVGRRDSLARDGALIEQAKALLAINASGNTAPRVPNLAVDIIQRFIDTAEQPAPAQRCAECDCKHGDRCCTWIKSDEPCEQCNLQPAPDAVAERPLPHIRFGVHSRPINPNDDR